MRYIIDENEITLILDGKQYIRAGVTDQEIEAFQELCAELRFVQQTENGFSEEDERIAKQELIDFMSPIARLRTISDEVEIDQDSGLMRLIGDEEYMDDYLSTTLRKLYETDQLFLFNSLVLFWKKVKQNPNPESRKALFRFLQNNGHPITVDGNFIAYKAVRLLTSDIVPETVGEVFAEQNDGLAIDFVKAEYRRRKDQKKAPSNFVVVWNPALQSFKSYFQDSDSLTTVLALPEAIEYGSLSELYDEAIALEESASESIGSIPVFTDIHSGTMKIVLGKEVTMDRGLCDEDNSHTCSRGLKCVASY